MEESSDKCPFYSSSVDLIEEEYYNEQLPEKKCRFTPDQVHRDMEQAGSLEPARKTQLATETSCGSVAIGFC
ncbi:Homeobox-leucine zipper protein [Ranunculus cassubicifolius]